MRFKTLSEKSDVFALTCRFDASQSKTLSAGVRERFREKQKKKKKERRDDDDDAVFLRVVL